MREWEELTPEDYFIAKQNGLDRKTVYQRFYNYGWNKKDAITKPKQPNNVKRFPKGLTVEKYRYFKKQGMTEEEIGRLFGISRVSLYRWRVENHI
jgi:DNA invertase Pin-like site-specific DNA recombinase